MMLGAVGGPIGLLAGSVIGGMIGSTLAGGQEGPEPPDGRYAEESRRRGDDSPLVDVEPDGQDLGPG